MCVLAVAGNIKVGLTKVGNQAIPLNHSEKQLHLVPIRADVQHMATDLNTQPTTM
jgi:hypothetical protein